MNAKKLTILAMLSAIAFLLAAFVRVPVVLFLRYDPKDVVIVIGGFLFGPLAALMISVVVSFTQMITVSSTGFIGFFMNVLGSAAFCCTASYIYQKQRNMKGAVIGLGVGAVLAISAMLLWNYFLTPIFMGWPREDVVAILLPAILPFNLIAYVGNGALTILVYKHVKRALVLARLLPPPPKAGEGEAIAQGGRRVNWGLMAGALFVIVSAVLWVLILQGII